MFSSSSTWQILLLFCLTLSRSNVLSLDTDPGNEQSVLGDSLGFIKDTVERFREANSVAALSLAITKDDRLVYAEAFGYANYSTEEVVTPEYRFRVASVSKTVTAVTIMSLYEHGYLNLTEKVLGKGAILENDYGSEPYSAAELAITVQHLLEHSSGFIDDAMGGDPTYQQQWLWQSEHELVGTVLDAFDPTAWPGTNASYSNFGYMILGRVVEKVIGQRYFDYVYKRILEPIDAKGIEIGVDVPTQKEVSYYDSNSSAPYHLHLSRRDSVGALIARPVDLVALLTSVDGNSRRPDILRKSTEKTFYEKSTVYNSSYAKGWDSVSFSDDGSLVEAGKGGGLPGTTSWVSVRANESITYAVVVNKALDSSKEMKAMIDGIMLKVKEWPDIDLFPGYGIDRTRQHEANTFCPIQRTKLVAQAQEIQCSQHRWYG